MFQEKVDIEKLLSEIQKIINKSHCDLIFYWNEIVTDPQWLFRCRNIRNVIKY